MLYSYWIIIKIFKSKNETNETISKLPEKNIFDIIPLSFNLILT